MNHNPAELKLQRWGGGDHACEKITLFLLFIITLQQMFTYKPQFIAASKRSAQVARSIFVRLSSSSSSSATKLENVVEKDKAAAKPSTNNSGEQQQPFQLAADKAKSTKIPFMPVINIPETEFAHHSFFSLHRPLLGLSDDDEKPFFNSKSTEEQDQEKREFRHGVAMVTTVWH